MWTWSSQAIKEKASDIHFEPFEKEFKIRYRVDGSLYEMQPPPVHLSVPVISRVKVMANMNIAERRVPQDGRIVKQIGNRAVDMRVSSLPTQYGESVVLRVLDRSSVNLNLDNLGLPPHIHEYILDTVHKPNGIFIVTGPTGAGKTTTLYAALREINTIDSKVLTAEDPVEYDIDGIIQIPINEAIGLDFPMVLRAFLRQDPDRILVGEMRDMATAQIAIQASLTGHLVLSTLHTNDSAGAITRLVDMGCEPFLVAASLEGVLAQRLVRTICPDCRTPYEPSSTILSQLGVSPYELGDKHFFTGRGCDKFPNPRRCSRNRTRSFPPFPNLCSASVTGSWPRPLFVPNAVILAAVVAILYAIFTAMSKTPNGRRKIDSALLTMPVIGNVQSKSAIARFARTFGTLVTSGVPILQALTITKTPPAT